MEKNQPGFSASLPGDPERGGGRPSRTEEVFRQALARLEQRAQALLEAGLTLTSERDLEVLLRRFVDVARELTEARYGALGVLGPEGRIQQFLASGLSPEEQGRIGALPQGRGVLGLLLQGRPLRLADLARHPASVGFPPHHPPMKSFLGVPILARGQVFGNLYLTGKADGAEFTAQDEAIAVILAAYAAVAVLNAQLFTSLEQKRREAQILYDVGQSITRSLNLEAVFHTVVQAAASILEAQHAYLLTVDSISGHLQPAALSGFASEPWSLRLGEGALGQAAQRGTPLLLPDLSDEAAEVPPVFRAHGIRALVGAPVRIGGQVYGLLGVGYSRPHVIPPGAGETLAALADQAAIAILNAELFRDVSQERQSLDATFESLAEGVYTLDSERHVLRINSRAADLARTTRLEALGRPCQELFQYRDSRGRSICATACPVLQALETGEAVPAREAVLMDGGGDEVPVTLSVSPIRDRDQRTVGAVEVVQDMRHKRALEELRNSIVSLASHELRTPLTNIKGFASTLLQKDVEWDEETRTDFLRSIEGEADRLARLVGDLLDLSRLESGERGELERVPCELRSLVEQALESVAFFTRQHEVHVRLPDRLPLVLAVPHQVERVISNLVENAAKYTPAGTRITVVARGGGSQVLFQVRDRGPGIPPEDRERVFEKFTRLKHPGQAVSGAGLGLALCRAIVEAHGGRIWVEESPGGGAAFSFTLPTAPPPGRRRPRRFDA